jgi:hypothetical protein
MFGISVLNEPYKGFQPGVSHVVYDKDVSLGAITGINNKAFWFLFIKLDEKYHAPNIPRYSPEDQEAMAQEHRDRKLTEEVAFHQLWDTRVKCTVVALEEGVMDTWFNERTVLVGDSAHTVSKVQRVVSPSGYTDLADDSKCWTRRQYGHRERCPSRQPPEPRQVGTRRPANQHRRI